jgi:hypothetical protein
MGKSLTATLLPGGRPRPPRPGAGAGVAGAGRPAGCDHRGRPPAHVERHPLRGAPGPGLLGGPRLAGRNWARLGLLYLNDGVWPWARDLGGSGAQAAQGPAPDEAGRPGERLLPEGFARFVATPAPAWRSRSTAASSGSTSTARSPSRGTPTTRPAPAASTRSSSPPSTWSSASATSEGPQGRPHPQPRARGAERGARRGVGLDIRERALAPRRLRTASGSDCGASWWGALARVFRSVQRLGAPRTGASRVAGPASLG